MKLKLFIFITIFMLVILLRAFGTSTPAETASSEPTHPEKVLVFRSEGGPDLWQKLSPKFSIHHSLAKAEEDFAWAIRVVYFSMAQSGKNCDQLESVMPAVKGRYVGLRAACIGDDGFYRTYFVSRHIDDKTGPFFAAYWED